MSKKSKNKKEIKNQSNSSEKQKEMPTLNAPPVRPSSTEKSEPIPIAKPTSKLNKSNPKSDGKFHNPYNFIPSLKRKGKDTGLEDFEPKGHKEYLEDYWSGEITCTLTTKTPLLIPDAANLTEEKVGNKSDPKDDNKHNTYPVRIVNDKPYLAPTSVKGMLRNAYEAVTNSRFGVFEEHSDRLAYRMSASNVKLAPARVEYQDDKLVLRLMNDNELMGYAGKLSYYSTSATDKDKNQCDEEITFPLRYKDSNDKPEHGDKVWVRLNERGNGPKKTIITRIRRRTDGSKPPGVGKWRPGWVCITGQNIKGKKYERVFLERNNQQSAPITEEVKTMWKELIENYREIHKKDLEKRKKDGKKPWDYINDDPGQTAWSQHIYTKDAEKLTEGTLCYVDYDERSKRIKAILPVIISRRFYDIAPQTLLDRSLRPATELKKLSPSDRVFGWVNQQGTGAYRGQLRINQVQYRERYDEKQNLILPILEFPEGLPLGILGEPKPQQVRFYVAESKQGKPLNSTTKKEAAYKPEKSLRGRKVYPHQQNVDWEKPTEDKPQNKEYRRPESIKDTQNRSVEGWIKPETAFEFTLNVVNLSSVELGALLWLLDLAEYQKNDNEEKKELFHRLGGGKPFGFGSVQIEITEADLRLGDSWRKFYASLLPVEPPKQEFNDCVEAFKNAVKNAYSKEKFNEVEFIDAFIKCAKGFDDNLPVHYPRLHLEAEAENKNYEWFVENERGSESTIGRQLPLPALTEDKGLPYKPSEPKPKKR